MFVCSRAWGVSVVVVFVRAFVGFCLVGVLSGLCGVVWVVLFVFVLHLSRKKKGKSIGEAMALHFSRPVLQSFGY